MDKEIYLMWEKGELIMVEEPLEGTVTPVKFRVSVLPDDYQEGWAWDLMVEYRDKDKWAVVLRDTRCLSVDGTWNYEPSPSSRTEEWKAAHRFTFDEAIRLAKKEAPNVAVNDIRASALARRLQEEKND